MADAAGDHKAGSEDYRIGMLWIEGPLSYLEQLCIVSFLDAGHDVVLYHYGPVTGVPEHVTLADANEIMEMGDVAVHTRTQSPAPHADRFRYRLLQQTDGLIWADTDAYCVRPFHSETGHFYGWESDHHINVGVLGFPRDSVALAGLVDFTSDPYAIPTWYKPATVRQYEEAKAAGQPVHVGDMPWGVWGPHALTHFLKQSGEDRYALPTNALYPVSFRDRRHLLRPAMDLSDRITEDTLSVHLYGRRMRKRLIHAHGGFPRPRSWLGRALRRHGIDPEAAPLPAPAADGD